ncbi:5,6-dimethylbenzimidazole synthase [Halocynthiibacter styelae]|uniref:5,6-dimethylbenzimidazole synthase n=1 Tax=Halocynthiibacter styelae TaxID=2761955 RepID=A0A8J7IC91_9RHOB|nr:5,6-dimethylbenzimidazole synthase [Paenihalocynthiibacter styelae]MBI1493048.1 5,6-dimethylbenzimidazole synthase [Paenihalocynthiibacter styelae]
MDSFSEKFRTEFDQLLRWRRDVRHFRPDPVEEAQLMRLLSTFSLAPSVGLSEPWRIVRVKDTQARKAAEENFLKCNEQALAGYSGEKAKIYAGLKLSGMRDAPVQLAIFCDEDTDKGAGLGAGTMPEMRRYSVVTAVTQFWLAARAEGLGVGWVSILDPEQLTRDLNVSENWRLVAWLCVGWPETNTMQPELEREGWEARSDVPQITER